MKFKVHKSKFIVAAAVVLLVAVVGCSKQKTCRCSVMGTERVRIIKIDNGECTQLHVFQGHDEVDSVWVDSLLCTDYEFRIDSIYHK